MSSALPFDDIRNLIDNLVPGEQALGERVREVCMRSDPVDAMSDIGNIAVWLATWSRRRPSIMRPLVAIFASTHGVARHGASEVTADYVARHVAGYSEGGTPLNQMCATLDLGLKVFELALEIPTFDITEDAAMDERDCAATMAFGMEAVAGADLLCVAGLAASAEISSIALLAALHGGEDDDLEMLAGLGTPEQNGLVDKALSTHGAHLNDPLEMLRRLGGRETAAIAGAILAARVENMPVILDGIQALAAASVLHRLNPEAIAHCLLASVEEPLRDIAAGMEFTPMINLHLGTAEASAFGAGILKSAVAAYNGAAAHAEQRERV